MSAPQFAALRVTDPGGDDAELSASGAAQVERGTWYSDDFERGDAELRLVAEDCGGCRN